MRWTFAAIPTIAKIRNNLRQNQTLTHKKYPSSMAPRSYMPSSYRNDGQSSSLTETWPSLSFEMKLYINSERNIDKHRMGSHSGSGSNSSSRSRGHSICATTGCWKWRSDFFSNYMRTVSVLNSSCFCHYKLEADRREPLAGVAKTSKQIRCHRVRERYEGLWEGQGGDRRAWW